MIKFCTWESIAKNEMCIFEDSVFGDSVFEEDIESDQVDNKLT